MDRIPSAELKRLSKKDKNDSFIGIEEELNYSIETSLESNAARNEKDNIVNIEKELNISVESSFESEAVLDKNNNIDNVEVESVDGVASTSNTVTPKTKRPRILWSSVRTSETLTEAHDFLIAEGFKRHEIKENLKGSSTYYRCGKVKQKSKEQCKAKRMIFQDKFTANFEIRQLNAEHTCNKIDECHRANLISTEMEQMVIECHEKRMTPVYIAAHINEMREKFKLFVDEKTPSITQIYYIIRADKAVKTPKLLYLGELIDWCEKNVDVPTDIDKPFVIGFMHSEEDENLNFKIVVSTRRMIQHCAGQEHLSVDAMDTHLWLLVLWIK